MELDFKEQNAVQGIWEAGQGNTDWRLETGVSVRAGSGARQLVLPLHQETLRFSVTMTANCSQAG